MNTNKFSSIVIGAIFFSIPALPGCKVKNSIQDSKINVLGGKAAEAQDFPFVIQLALSPTQPELCTGVIIGPRTVIAASHCIKQESRGMFHKPVAIFYDQNNQEQKIPGKEVYTFSKTLNANEIVENDVGLDFVIVDFGQISKDSKGPFSFLSVFPSLAQPNPDLEVTLVGFGATKSGTRSNGRKNYGSNKIAELNPRMGLITITGNEEAGFNSALATRGDSGGPILSKDGKQIIGLSSALYIEPSNKMITNYFVDLNSKHVQTLLGFYKGALVREGHEFSNQELLGTIPEKSFDELISLEQHVLADMQWNGPDAPKKLQPTCALISFFLFRNLLRGNNNNNNCNFNGNFNGNNNGIFNGSNNGNFNNNGNNNGIFNNNGNNNGIFNGNNNGNFNNNCGNLGFNNQGTNNQRAIQITKNWPFGSSLWALNNFASSKGSVNAQSKNSGLFLNGPSADYQYKLLSNQSAKEIQFNKFTSNLNSYVSIPLDSIDSQKINP